MPTYPLTHRHHYYSFGSSLKTRSYSAGSGFRFGFNGKENFDQYQDYGFRIYYPSLGRFLSFDPLSNIFPFWSPFAFAFNNPILNIDLDGLEGVAASHRIYFSNGGIPLLRKLMNSEIGFSPLGIAFALGQSAWESGYGNEIDIIKKVKANNYWGMKSNGKVVNYSSFNKGFEAWKIMMTSKFSSAYELLKKDNFTVDELEKGLNYGTYSYDPITKGHYAKDMLSNSKYVLNRFIKVLDENIKHLQSEAANFLKDENGKAVAYESLSEDKKLSYNNKINEINEMAGLRAKLREAIKAVKSTLTAKSKN